jgi:CRP-like cAMP-binding protein
MAKPLSDIEILKGLNEIELRRIGEISEEKHYRSGEVIFSEKSKGDELFIVKKGKVQIELQVKGKTDKATVHYVEAGDTFGELALVDEGSRSATTRAAEETDVLVLARSRLFELFEQEPRIGYMLMRNIATLVARRLRKTNLQLIACILWGEN